MAISIKVADIWWQKFEVLKQGKRPKNRIRNTEIQNTEVHKSKTQKTEIENTEIKNPEGKLPNLKYWKAEIPQAKTSKRPQFYSTEI